LDHGVKGSRVSVASGSAQLERGRLRNTVFAGQQYATSNALYHVPIASEFAWSQDASQYLALLKEFSGFQKDLESIPSPGLRYASELAPYLPADTIVYAAIPNLGSTIDQARQMFDSRLAESAVLRDWWQRQQMSQNGEFDRLLKQVSSISSYLGNEIVLGMTSDGGQQHGQPVFLAAIRQPGLAEYIKANLPSNAGVYIVGSTATPPAAKGLFVQLDNNVLVASTSLERVRQAESVVQAPSGSAFSTTPLFARVKEVYSTGAGYFLAADLEQIVSKSVKTGTEKIPQGLDNAKYLVLERKDVSGSTQMRAALSFDGTRQGVASWLAAPGPAASLDFVSPDASLAASIVMKNPRAMMQEMISYGSNAGNGFAKHLSEFESKAGVSLLDDVAAPLGSDATFAIDGPGLPTSSWKVAIEVYDPEHFKHTLATLVERFNQQAPSADAGNLLLTSHPVGDLLIYSLSNPKWAGFSISYTFVDGYILAAGSESNLVASVQNKRTGQTLASSSDFRSRLPADRYTNFSGMFYQNVGKTLGPLAEQMKNTNALNEQQRQSLSTLLSDSGPGLICVYGERDRIIAASTGSFFGFNLGTLAGIHQGKPIVPLIAANADLYRPKSVKPN
jgi:hypothetical protein